MRSIPAKSWFELSATALRGNLRAAQHLMGSVEVIPVIKANAYGHGAEYVAKALADEAFPFLAIDSYEEALELYDVQPAPRLLILGYIPQVFLNEVVASGYSFVCSKLETVQAAAAVASATHPAHLHLEIETGLYRQGANAVMLAEMLAYLASVRDRVVVEGICSHFANTEQISSENTYPDLQEQRFFKALAQVEDAGFSPRYRHIACSSAIWTRSTPGMNAVRLGLSLYGVSPSADVSAFLEEQHPHLGLQPVLTWKTLVAEQKLVASGEPIGYDLTERVTRPTRVAILPIGYADGFDRRLSSVGYVLVHGQRCKVLGRVCMNMCMIDVTHVPDVQLEDEVVILGNQKGTRVTVEDWERWAPGLIGHEAFARLRRHTPTLLVEGARA